MPADVVVDLRSDTVTKPSEEMRQVIAGAEVGDAVLGDDQTALELEAVTAELLGKDAALFFPSGTMANQTAILVQSRPGTEVLVQDGAHVMHYEEAAAAAWAGVQLRSVTGPAGESEMEAFRIAAARSSPYMPAASMLCIENTHNRAGGSIFPIRAMEALGEIARERGLPIHLDGARLPNAAIATGLPMSAWTEHADTVMVSLSKGLGAPIGSVLAGSREAMQAAWRVRRRLGGGMRQVGLLAAAGLFALRKNFDRLHEDHRRARELARAVCDIGGVTAEEPQTNIVMIDISPELYEAEEVVAALRQRGVLMTAFGRHRVRAVTHLDVDDRGIQQAIAAFREEVAG